jgi:hypothetical protein
LGNLPSFALPYSPRKMRRHRTPTPRRKKSRKHREPDAIIHGGPITFAKFGKQILGFSNRTPEEHKQDMQRAADALPLIVEKIDRAVDRARGQISAAVRRRAVKSRMRIGHFRRAAPLTRKKHETANARAARRSNQRTGPCPVASPTGFEPVLSP